MGNPYPLKQNQGKSFQGSIVLGKGFVLTPQQAEELIAKDPRNKDVLFPYLNGEDLNNDPEQKPSRWVINFFDWSEEKARTYPDCFEIVERLVKPERDAYDENKNAWNKSVKRNWWQFGAWRKNLEETISKVDQVIVVPLVSKYTTFEIVSKDVVFMHKIGVIVKNDYSSFSILSSSIHNSWCWKNSSTLGAGTLNYSSTHCFETFPFPKQDTIHIISLEELGKTFLEYRKNLQKQFGLGLTKLYNQFHNKHLNNISDNDKDLNKKDFEKKYGKTSLVLQKHLTEINSSFDNFIEGIKILRLMQLKIDEAVITAYGWQDIQLKHNFYELEYLPEKDNIRYTIHPKAREEILKRLTLLNQYMYKKEID